NVQVFDQLLAGIGAKRTKDNTDNLLKFFVAIRNMPSYLQIKYGQMFGMDERTVVMFQRNLPELIKAQEGFKKAAGVAGLDLGKASEDFHAFMVDVRALLRDIELLAIAFGVKILPAARAIVQFLDRAVTAMLALHRATDGWSTAIGGILAALGGAVGAIKILRGAMGLFGIGGGAAAAAGAGEAAVVGGAAVAGE